ncbi:MAG: efflux RND transporter periplasmic adaptor subunit [Deltaproteobacteria bacterium]|nr:efflux RND transporter periplasmic adaptor subunit [Deltaproteobacteria bacterium]
MRTVRTALWVSLLTPALALAACKKKEGETTHKEPPKPVKVSLATVGEAETPDQIVLTGTLAADQRAEVTADVQGKVLEVMVDRGDRVKQGANVVRLDVQNAGLAAREAMANVASARAQRQLAEEECKRTQTLLEKGAITRSEFDRQNATCTSAVQQVAAAEARAAMMAKSMTDGIVRAPFEGIVSERNVNIGEWVAPGRSLFTLVDDDPLRIQLSVPEAVVPVVKEKQKVEVIAVADREKVHMATVTRIGGEIGRSRSLIVEATLDPNSGLKPGMFAEAHLLTGKTTKYPIVAKEAVVKRGKTWHVFTVKKGELHDQIVQLGPEPEPGKVSVIQGLKKGDKVVGSVVAKMVKVEATGSGSSGSASGSGSGSGDTAEEATFEERLVTKGPDGKDVYVVDGLAVEE